MTRSRKTKSDYRTDGLYSALMGFGVSSKDKRQSTTFLPVYWTQTVLSNFYSASDIFAKCVDEPVEAMTKNGFRVCKEDGEVTAEVQEWLDKHGLDEKIEDALKLAKIYGGAGILLGLDDSLDDPSKPFMPRRFKELKWATAFDRFYLTATEFDRDPSSSTFKKPKKYQLGYFSEKSRFSSFHASRLIRFEGVKVSDSELPSYGYWGDSILTRIRDSLTDYCAAHVNAAYLLQDTGRMVFEFSKLYEMLAMDGNTEGGSGNGTAALQARLRALELSASSINGYVVGEGEKAERAMINLAGIPELLEKAKERLAAATQLPHTILFNESPSGLGATGNTEMTQWYEKLSAQQESVLRPPLQKLVDIFFLETEGKIPKYSLKFNPLTVPTPTEIADVQTKRVTNVRGLVQDMLITPDAGIESLNREDDIYSLGIEIDEATNSRLENAKPDDDEAPDAAVEE